MSSSKPRPAVAKPTHKRPDEICEQIKNWIVERQLQPGDRLPQEKELIQLFKASKSTVREALRALHTQGLVNTRTGPGGGAFIAALDANRAMELLSNHFFFRQPTLDDIYELRKQLEPELAASLAGKIGQGDFQRLHDKIRLYDHPAANLGEEYAQRIAELDFHNLLAELCPNPLLGFICGFLQNLLKDLAICRRIYDEPNPELRESGLHYQVQLLRALKRGNADDARAIMYQHMCAAHQYMKHCEAELTSGFL
jgi:GntR family transcriptional repressor for pyruvate dehydrogenase complex